MNLLGRVLALAMLAVALVPSVARGQMAPDVGASGAVVVVNPPGTESPSVAVGAAAGAVAPGSANQATGTVTPVVTGEQSAASTTNAETTTSVDVPSRPVAERQVVVEGASEQSTSTAIGGEQLTDASARVVGVTVQTPDVRVGVRMGKVRVISSAEGDSRYTRATTVVDDDGPRPAVTLFDGLVTVESASATAEARPTARGGSTVVGFKVTGVRIRQPGRPSSLVHVHSAISRPAGRVRVDVELRPPGRAPDRAKVEIARGQDLLSDDCFEGTTLQDEWEALGPLLQRLRRSGGALEGLGVQFGRVRHNAGVDSTTDRVAAITFAFGRPQAGAVAQASPVLGSGSVEIAEATVRVRDPLGGDEVVATTARGIIFVAARRPRRDPGDGSSGGGSAQGPAIVGANPTSGVVQAAVDIADAFGGIVAKIPAVFVRGEGVPGEAAPDPVVTITRIALARGGRRITVTMTCTALTPFTLLVRTREPLAGRRRELLRRLVTCAPDGNTRSTDAETRTVRWALPRAIRVMLRGKRKVPLQVEPVGAAILTIRLRVAPAARWLEI